MYKYVFVILIVYIIIPISLLFMLLKLIKPTKTLSDNHSSFALISCIFIYKLFIFSTIISPTLNNKGLFIIKIKEKSSKANDRNNKQIYIAKSYLKSFLFSLLHSLSLILYRFMIWRTIEIWLKKKKTLFKDI